HKLSANNIIVNHRSLRISITQPTGAHAEIVTSNVIKFMLEGSVVGPESASHVSVAVSCDDVAAEVTRTPILTSNGLVGALKFLGIVVTLMLFRNTLLF